MLRLFLVLLLVLTSLTLLWQLDGAGLLSLLVDESGRWPALIISTLIYMILISIPFVPGVELGWLIIGVFGRAGIVAAWAATVAGLAISYCYARLLRHHRLLQKLEEQRISLLAASPQNLTRGACLLQKSLRWHARHPYLFVLLTLNIPGNWVIGGGGGIACLSGATPGVRFVWFVMISTVATGIIPVILLLGS